MNEFQSDPHWALFDEEVAKMRRALGEAVRTKAELDILKEKLATKDTEIARLREALERLRSQAESYMDYHIEKFYDGDGDRVGGLRQPIAEARAALDATP